MADEQVVGMNYFDHQFLRTGDFETAQQYHLDRLRQHNRMLHRAGIVDGLEVTRTGPRSVEVKPGRAVDQAHREVVLRQTAASEVPILLRVQTVDGILETEVQMTGAALSIQLDRVLPSTAAGNSVFLTILQGVKQTTPSADPGITAPTRLVERAVIEASTAPLSGAQLLLAQINRNPDGTIAGELNFTNRQVATAHLANNSVVSAKIAEADAATGQNTNTGAGIKTGHIQDRAVTAIKIAENTIQRANLDATLLQSIGIGGWVRLPFLPKPLLQRRGFVLSPTHSRSDGQGASGIMEIPVPPGATRITQLRVAYTENGAGIAITLWRARIDTNSSDTLLSQTFNPGPPLNQPIPVPNGSLNSELEGLALEVTATGVSDINFIGAQFT